MPLLVYNACLYTICVANFKVSSLLTEIEGFSNKQKEQKEKRWESGCWVVVVMVSEKKNPDSMGAGKFGSK